MISHSSVIPNNHHNQSPIPRKRWAATMAMIVAITFMVGFSLSRGNFSRLFNNCGPGRFKPVTQ